VDRNFRESTGARLERVDDRHRLAVGKPGDEVGSITEVVEHILWHTALRL
jgi:hypothetical protein